MKELILLNVAALLKTELTTINGGSLDPDALREYIEERYGSGTAYDFSR